MNTRRPVKHGRSHDDRVVELLDGLYEVAAKSRYREYEFDDESAGCNCGDRRAEHGDDRQNCIAQFMLQEYPCDR